MEDVRWKRERFSLMKKKNIFPLPYSIFHKRSFIFLLSVFFSGCSLLGLHIKIHNPHKAGKYPPVSKALKLQGELTKYRSCYDVKYYNLNIDIDPAKQYINGHVAITSLATEDIDTLQFDLYKNMKLKRVSIWNNIVDKKHTYMYEMKIGYKRVEGAVFISTSEKISAGNYFTIYIDYEGSPQQAKKAPWDGGLVWKKDKQGNPWVGVACETEGASLWWPCKDHNSDEADSTSISISVPKGLMCVCNGQFKDSNEVDANRMNYSWFVSYPINNYDVTFYIGKLKLLHDVYDSPVTGKQLPLNHYVLPANYDIAKEHFQQLKGQLAVYEKLYGAYPWYNDGFKLVESPYAGMEHQSAIAYGNGFKNDYNNFDYIILHETAHEWWGNSVTAADLADVWLQEGFATYSEALYVESQHGKQAYLNYLRFQRMFIINRRPVVGPVGRRWFWYKDGDVYMKGTWVLHTLRSLINNDNMFFDIIKSFRVTYNMKTVSSQNFIDLVNARSGKDYLWFFKQYLYNRFTPVLEYKVNGSKFIYQWSHTDIDFSMPISVRINGTLYEISPFVYKKSILDAKEPIRENELQFNDDMMLFGKKKCGSFN